MSKELLKEFMELGLQHDRSCPLLPSQQRHYQPLGQRARVEFSGHAMSGLNRGDLPALVIALPENVAPGTMFEFTLKEKVYER